MKDDSFWSALKSCQEVPFTLLLGDIFGNYEVICSQRHTSHLTERGEIHDVEAL